MWAQSCRLPAAAGVTDRRGATPQHGAWSRGLTFPTPSPAGVSDGKNTTRTQKKKERGTQTHLLLCAFSPPPRYKPLCSWRGRAGEPCASGPTARADFTAGETLSCVTAPHHVSRRSLKNKKNKIKYKKQTKKTPPNPLQIRSSPRCRPPFLSPCRSPGSLCFSLLPLTAPQRSALSLLSLLVYSRCLPACQPYRACTSAARPRRAVRVGATEQCCGWVGMMGGPSRENNTLHSWFGSFISDLL